MLMEAFSTLFEIKKPCYLKNSFPQYYT